MISHSEKNSFSKTFELRPLLPSPVSDRNSEVPLSLYVCEYLYTRRVPVQRAVERDEIPYPYKVHDTTLRPLLNITIQKHNYIANYISRIY